jgi:MFS family permease
MLYLYASKGIVGPYRSVVEKTGKGSFGRVVRNRNVQALCVARALFSFTAATFATLFPVYARQTLFLAPSVISMLFVARGTVNTLVRLPSGKLSDKIGRKTPILIGYVALTLVFSMLAVVREPLAIALIMGLYGFAWGMRVPSETAMISDSLSAKDVALGIAFLQTMFPLGVTVGSVVSGVAAQYFAIPTIFLASATLTVPAVAAVLTLPKFNRKE